MKSYLINNLRIPQVDLDLWRNSIHSSDDSFNNYFNAEYRNMIDKDSFKTVTSSTFPNPTLEPQTNFPVSNIELDTNTKEVRYNSNPDENEAVILLELNKNDNEGYSSIVVKFNKLNKEFIDEAKAKRMNLNFTFTDGTAISGYSGNGITAHPTPLSSKTFQIRMFEEQDQEKYYYSFNGDEMIIFISPEMLDTLDLVDRNANSTNKIYHRHLFISTSITSYTLNYFPVSNISCSNPIKVELENGAKVSYNNLTQNEENKNGVVFKDIYNTIKEIDYTLPLLENLEERNLDKNFFKVNQNESFYIFPMSQEYNPNVSTGILDAVNDTIENFKYGGHFWMDGDYEIEREEYDLYKIDFSVKEVI